MNYLSIFKKVSQAGSRSLRLTSMMLSLILLVVFSDVTAFGQGRDSGQTVVTSLVPTKNQASYLRKAEKSSNKDGNYIQATKEAARAILTRGKKKAKRTAKAFELLKKSYPKAEHAYKAHLAEIGKIMQSITDVDKKAAMRKRQLMVFKDHLILHQLLEALPPGYEVDFLDDTMELEADLSVAEVLLELAETEAADFHFEAAFEELKKQTKSAARNAYLMFQKTKRYNSEAYPTLDSLLMEAKNQGQITLQIKTHMGSNLAKKYGPLAQSMLGDIQEFMRRQYGHNPFVNPVYGGDTKADFVVLFRVNGMLIETIKVEPTSHRVSKETKSKEGAVKTVLGAVQKHQQRVLSTAHLGLTITDPTGAIMETKTANGTYLWTNTYSKLLSGNKDAAKGSKWEGLLKKQKQPLPNPWVISENSTAEALAVLKLELHQFIQRQLSN